MSEHVPAEDIERIVKAPRHPTLHRARAVRAEEKVYLLHSQECLDSIPDLRTCRYSLAMDRGIDHGEWEFMEDCAVEVVIDDAGLLTPWRAVA